MRTRLTAHGTHPIGRGRYKQIVARIVRLECQHSLHCHFLTPEQHLIRRLSLMRMPFSNASAAAELWPKNELILPYALNNRLPIIFVRRETISRGRRRAGQHAL
jgi:hypothetical protein